MRKFVCAAVVTAFAVSFAVADDFTALISKLDDGKVTFKKTEKGKTVGEDITLSLAKDAKIHKGKGKKGVYETVGDALEKTDYTALITKGIEGKAKGANAYITTDADGKTITRILLLQGKKKKTD